MQNLKLKLMDQGLVGSLILRESGAQIPLRFNRGEFSKLAKLNLGPTTMEVELRLEEIPGVGPELPNLTLTIVPAGQRSAAPAVSSVEEPPPPTTPELNADKPVTPPPAPGVDDETLKAEAEAKTKADAEKAQADAEAAAKAEAEKAAVEEKAQANAEPTKSEEPKTTTQPPPSSGGRKNR